MTKKETPPKPKARHRWAKSLTTVGPPTYCVHCGLQHRLAYRKSKAKTSRFNQALVSEYLFEGVWMEFKSPPACTPLSKICPTCLGKGTVHT